MRITKDGIDGAGNFILSRNQTCIYIESGVKNRVITNLRIHGIHGDFKDKMRVTWEALKFIWKDKK